MAWKAIYEQNDQVPIPLPAMLVFTAAECLNTQGKHTAYIYIFLKHIMYSINTISVPLSKFQYCKRTSTLY
jgi:hypothetical protein